MPVDVVGALTATYMRRAGYVGLFNLQPLLGLIATGAAVTSWFL